MPVGERQPVGLHLAWLLSVIIAGAFVTVLIIVTGDLTTFWPLYLVPIVLASLAYHAPGAIVSVAVCGALIVLLAYGAGNDAPTVQALVVGALAFAVSGLVVGVQARRYQQQRQRLEHDTTRDDVTGAYGADYFSARLAEEVGRCARYGESLTLALVRPSRFRGLPARLRAGQGRLAPGAVRRGASSHGARHRPRRAPRVRALLGDDAVHDRRGGTAGCRAAGRSHSRGGVRGRRARTGRSLHGRARGRLLPGRRHRLGRGAERCARAARCSDAPRRRPRQTRRAEAAARVLGDAPS